MTINLTRPSLDTDAFAVVQPALTSRLVLIDTVIAFPAMLAAGGWAGISVGTCSMTIIMALH